MPIKFMSDFKAIETNEIVNAIEELIKLKLEVYVNDNKGWGTHQSIYDAIEVSKRTIIDGLRYHSAAHGIVGDTNDPV